MSIINDLLVNYEQNPKDFFSRMVNLRERLGAQAYINNAFCGLAAGLTDLNEDFKTNVDGIIGAFDAANQTLTLINTFTDKQITLDVEDINVNLDLTLPDSDLSLGDWFGTVSKSGDLYVTLSSITAKFAYSSRMTLTDINALIDKSVSQYSNINQDVSDLRDQLVQLSDNSGYVSGRSWLLCLKNWFDRAEEDATDGSPAMDTSKSFTLQAVYTLVVSALLSTLASILTAVRNVFAVLIGILTNLIGFIFNKLASTTTGVTVDHDAPNNFIAGPVNFIELRDTFNGPHDYQIWYRSKGSLTSFFWYNTDYSKMKLNTYYNPKYTAEYVYDQISRYNDVVITSERIYYTGNSVIDIFPGDPDDESIIEYNNVGMFAAICLDCFVRAMAFASNRNFLYGGNPNGRIVVSCNPSHNGTTDVYGYFSKCAALGAHMVYNISVSQDYMNGITFNQLEQYVHDYIGAVNAIGGDSQYYPSSYSSWVFVNETTADVKQITWSYSEYGHTDMIMLPIQFFILFPLVEAGQNKWIDNGNNLYREYDFAFENDKYLCNSLPTSFMFTLDSITNQAAISAAIWTGVISIAAVIGVLACNRALRLKRIKKSITRQDRIEGAKLDYQDNPTKENLNAYAKEVDRYNRMGKIFGWGSYDAANGWVDSAAGGNSIPSTAPMIGAVQSVTANTLQKAADNLLASAGIKQVADTTDGKVDGMITSISDITNMLPKIEAIYNSLQPDGVLYELLLSIKLLIKSN